MLRSIGMLAWVVVAAASVTRAQEPLGEGDPLPAGAVTRLGVSRFAVDAPVEHVAYPRDGRFIAAAWEQHDPSRDFGVAMWDAKTGRSVHRWVYRGSYLRDLTFLDDGKSLVAGGTWYDIESGRIMRLRDNRRARTIRRDGRRWVFSGDKYGIVHFFDHQLGESIATVIVKTKVNGYEQFAFSPKGNLAAGSTYDGQLHLYSGDDGKHLRALPLGEEGIASLLTFSPDELWLAAGGGYMSRIRVYDTESGDVVAELARHENDADVTALAFTPDGRYLASAGDDKKVRFWNVSRGEDVQALDTGIDHVSGLAFSPDGSRLVTGGRVGDWTAGDGQVRVWDLKSGRPLMESERSQRRYQRIAFSPNGRLVAAGVWRNQIHVFQVKSGRRILTLEGDCSQDLQFSADNWELIAVGSGAKYQVWEIPTGDEIRTSPNSLAYNAGFSRLLPDRKHLLSVAGMKTLIVDLKTCDTVREFDTAKEKMYLGQAAVSADGQFVVVNHRDRNKHGQDGLYVFDLKAGELQRWVEVNTIRKDHEVYSLLENPQLSADGGLVAAWVRYTPNSMLFWDVETGRQVHRMPNVTRSARFTNDGKYLLDIQGGDIVLVELATGRLAMRRTMLSDLAPTENTGPLGNHPTASVRPLSFVGQTSCPVSAMAVSLDGRTVATGMTRSNTILLWPLHDPTWSDYPPKEKPDAGQLNQYWSDLAGLDAAAAYRAIWFLAAQSETTEPFVVEKLREARPDRQNTERIKGLVKQLNSADGDQRDAAREELLILGAAAEPLLRAEAWETVSPDAKRRLQSVISVLQSPVQRAAGEPLRRIRLVQLLEQLATPKARQLLAEMAAGSKTARETRDAEAALVRLSAAKHGP